jgi:nicotinamidase-related amidase
VFLLLDHQSGLLQNVKDISVAELRANTTALAKLAALQQIPVITTASVPDGPNGPLMPEIHEAAPHAVYVPRKGEVNAWDNALFVKTVRETGLDRETAQKAVDSAHLECPYSKATHGNINVVTTLIDPSPRRPL